MSETTLHPCQHCGGSRLAADGGGRREPEHRIRCLDCNDLGPPGDTPGGARRAWNHRAEADRLTARATKAEADAAAWMFRCGNYSDRLEVAERKRDEAFAAMEAGAETLRAATADLEELKRLRRDREAVLSVVSRVLNPPPEGGPVAWCEALVGCLLEKSAMCRDLMHENNALDGENMRLNTLAWRLSTYAAAINWSPRETNTQEWLDGLKDRIEAVQAVAAPSNTAPKGDPHA